MNRPTRQRLNVAFLVAAFVVAAGLGWMAGTRAENGEAEAESRTREAVGPVGAESRQKLGEAEEARRKVDRIRAAASPEVRLRATIELVDGLTTEELIDWLRNGWFDFRDGFEQALFERLAMERWRREDPLAFATWRRQSDPEEAAWAVAQWIGEDRDRLQRYFEENRDVRERADLLSELATLQPSLAIESFLETMAGKSDKPRSRFNWGYFFGSFFERLAKSAPDELEAMLESLNPSVRRQAEGALWARRLRDPEGEGLRALMGHPEGFELLRDHARSIPGIGNRLFSALADLPESWRAGLVRSVGSFLDGADGQAWLEADYEALGFTADEAKWIRRSALQSLAQSDPAAALGKLDEIELTDGERRGILSTALGRWAVRNDEEKYEELLALLPSEEAREAARRTVPLMSQSGDGQDANLRTPQGWFERVANGERNPDNGVYFDMPPSSWTDEEFREVAERFRALQGEERDRVAEGLVEGIDRSADGTAAALRGEAILHRIGRFEASGESGGEAPADERSIIKLSSEHAVHWGLNDPEAARAWVQTLPEGEVRLWAQRNLAATWADYDPDAVAQWLGTLPAERRADVEGFMEDPQRDR